MIKLRQLSFYLQAFQQNELAKVQCEQAQQILIAHKMSSPKSHFFGIKEAQILLKVNIQYNVINSDFIV